MDKSVTEAFEPFKEAFTKSPILVYLDPTRPNTYL